MKHQIMSTLAAVCLVLLVFSGPAFAATYEVQSVTGTVAPYSTQNPYSPSLSVLLPTPKVSGSVTNSTINIQPILVTVSTPKGTTTQSFEGSGVPLTKAQNESYMSFGVWKAFSSSNPVTAWQTNGAYEAGTLSTTFPQSTVSYVGQAEAWITYRSSTPLKPSALLVGSSRISIDFVHGLVDVTIVFPSPSIALHGSVPLSATKHAYMSSSANLSGTGALGLLSGWALGHVYGPGGFKTAGTFAIGNQEIELTGAFGACLNTGSTTSC